MAPQYRGSSLGGADMCAKRKRGVVLVLTLWTLTLITGFVAVGLSRSVGEIAVTDRYLASQRAFHVAEAGLEAMLWEQAQAGCGTFLTDTQDAQTKAFTPLSFQAKMSGVQKATDGQYVVSIGSGTATVRAYEDPVNPNVTIIQSTGTADGITRTLEAYVLPAGQPLFGYAVLSEKQRIVMNGDASTDSYDSRKGPYSTLTNRGAKGTVVVKAVNKDIDLFNRAAIHGDAFAGGGSKDIHTYDSSTIDGKRASLPDAVVVPGIPTACPPGAVPLFTIADQAKLLASEVIEKPAGTYCAGDIELDGADQVRFQGPATVYAKSLSLTGTAVLGPTSEKPAELQVVVMRGLDGKDVGGEKVIGKDVIGKDVDGKDVGGKEVVGKEGKGGQKEVTPKDVTPKDVTPKQVTPKKPVKDGGTDGAKSGGKVAIYGQSKVYGAILAAGRVVVGGEVQGQVFGAVISKGKIVIGADEKTGPSLGAVHYDEALGDPTSGAPVIEGGGMECKVKTWRQM